MQEDSTPFIKIDTQGYEAQVLRGAECLLQKAAGLQVELSLVPLYAGQVLYDELISQVKSKGFELWGLTPVFIDAQSGRLLQADATFFRA